MAWKPPEAEGWAPPEVIGTTATQEPPAPAWEPPEASVDRLTSDSTFDPASHAAQNPGDFETAFAVQKARENRTFGEKAAGVGKTLTTGDTYKAAGKGVLNFLRGFGDVATNAAQALKNKGITLGFGPVSTATLPDKAPETIQAENTLAAQHGEESGKHLVDATVGRIAAGAAKMDEVDPAKKAWRESFLARNPTHRTPEQLQELKAQWVQQDAADKVARDEGIDRQMFQQKVDAAKNAIQLAQGRPLDTGAVAGIYHVAGQQPSEEVGPDALKAAGVAPTDPGVVERMAAASDPLNIALAAAPGLPGASKIGGLVTEGAGKALQLPGRAVAAAASPVTNAVSALRAISNPAGAALSVAKKGTAKGLGAIGQALEAQGKELRTGIPSNLTTEAATAAATGERAIGTNLQRKLGDAVATGASTAVGMAPLNAALADSPEDFARSEVGAAAFGGTLSAFKRNRPMLVEAIRPHLQSEGARALAEAAEGNDQLAARSAQYVMNLPGESRDRTLEAIGALQGLPILSKNGNTRAKLYVLSGPDYAQQEAIAVGGQPSPMGGGRGFFMGPDGAAYVNGDYHTGLGPNELTHTIGHEFGGHAAINIMRAAGAKGGALYNGLIGSAMQNLMPRGKVTPEFHRFIDGYNRAFDPTGQTKRLDPRNPEAIEEFISETAGQIMAGSGVGELAVPKNIQDRIADGIDRFMGSLIGVDTRKVGTESKFGRTESGEMTKSVQDTLAQVVGMKLREGSEIPEAPKTDTTRIGELQQIINTPRPTAGSPLTAVQEWLKAQRAARKELSDLQQAPQAAFPAAGAPPVPPSKPVATLPPPAPSRASVAAALRQNGIPASEAKVWADQARGSTVQEMVLDALKRRGAHKFPTETPPATTQPNLPPAATPETNGSQGTPAPEPHEPFPPQPAVATQEPPVAPPASPVAKPPVPAPPSRETVQALVENAEAGAVAAEKKPETKAAQTRIHDAKVNAILDAIGDDPNGIHREIQTDGTVKRVGNFDPANPYHQALVELAGGISAPALDSLTKMQDARDQIRFIRYRSALSSAEGEGGEGTMDTGMANRRAEYAIDPASERTEGTIQHKVVIPIRTVLSKSGKPNSSFFTLDNLLHNAESVREFMKEHPEVGEFPYKDESTLTRDAQVYADNHAHGWKGDGSGPIQGFPDSNLPKPDLNYQAEKIPKERFDALNLLMHSEDAGKLAARIQEVEDKRDKVATSKNDKERAVKQGVLERTITRMKNSEEAHALAELNNPWIDHQTGETNELRAKLKAAGFDTNESLKSPFETLDPQHILDVSESPIALQDGDIPTVRPTGFTAGAETMGPMQKLNPTAVRSNFMPADSAGAEGRGKSVEERAATLWKEQGTESPFFKKWFGDSKVIDERGNPMIVWHAGQVGDQPFLLKYAGDVGHHFGTKEAASRFGEPKAYYLKADRLLRTKDGGDTASWAKVIADSLEGIDREKYKEEISDLKAVANHWDELRESAESKVPFPKDETEDSVADWEVEVENQLQRDVAAVIRSQLKDLPFDAIVYENKVEGDGGDSFIIFRSNKLGQIKSATGNQGTFDASNPDIRFMPNEPTKPSSAQDKQEDYRGEHSAPMRDSGAPASDVASNGIYPEDFYGPNGMRYYGTGEDAIDRQSIAMIQGMRGRPNAKISVYRAVPYEPTNAEKIARYEEQKRQIQRRGNIPNDADEGNWKNSSDYYEHAANEIDRLKAEPDKEQPEYGINRGDWITINRQYAKDHVASALNGQGKVIKKTVSAKDIFTNGDSIHEWGYDPEQTTQEKAKKRMAARAK